LFRNRNGSRLVVNRIFRAQRPFLFEREFPSTRCEVGQLLVVTRAGDAASLLRRVSQHLSTAIDLRICEVCDKFNGHVTMSNILIRATYILLN
jgi:hypothetical protein